ncbi:hypothetical protein BO71DRAFT_400571 [Aspergillus ellipticus CBS 707.79]|uniref:Rhodopsin domain-containing protein n=1 Tax=Aspergillus ellipticus CBS 707.79 TaxID=1448320 RepID=A0A319D503_9EURO|nr:hypothetical protein BO71DRAFT_400571 [Aspergillus ellipticus CBS 707.79]
MNILSPNARDPRNLLGPRNGSDDSRAPDLLAIVGTLTGLSTLVLLLRCYVRRCVLGRFSAEEYLIVSASLCAIGVLVCFVLEAQHGLGRFTKDISAQDEEILSKVVYYHSIVVMVGLSLVKISLAVFLRRFSHNILSKALIGAIIFLVAFTIACGFTLIFQCVPVAAAWDNNLRVHARCFDVATYTAIGLWNSITNLVTDVIFATLPVPLFIGIQVNRRTKISLIGVLSLGYLVCVAGIVKIIAQVRVLKEENVYRHDTFMIWNCVELNVAILAACLPSLKPLLKSFLDTTRSLTTGRRNAYGSRYNSHGYYLQYSTDVPMKSMNQTKPSVYGVPLDELEGASNDGSGGEEDEQRLHRTETGILKTTEVVIQSQGG